VIFEAVVYFASPRTIFSGKIQEPDVILRKPAPFRWMARGIARSTHSQLDPARCGYAILDSDGNAVEHVEPQLPDPSKFERGKTTHL
jgi:hypothetical protein